jgi:hypothetical protein
VVRRRGESAVARELLESAWAGHLRGGGLAASLDLEGELVLAVARALGDDARTRSVEELPAAWPACLVVALSTVAAGEGRDGDFWPAWHRALGTRPSRAARQAWGEAFLNALRHLGRELPLSPEQAVLVHAGTGAVTPRAGMDESYDPEGVLLAHHGGPCGRELAERIRRSLAALTRGDQDTAETALGSLPWRIAEAVRHARPAGPVLPPLRLEPYGRGVLMAAAGQERQWCTATPDRVAPDGGLLLFDEDGMLLSAVLPAAPVWVLRPAGWALCGDVPLRTVVESTLPLPWRDWKLTQIALDGVGWLVAGTERRRVAGRPRPRLLAGSALPGLTTAEGRAVRASLPSLRFPAGEGAWQVEVRRGAGGPVLSRAQGSSGDWDDQRLWQRLPRPFVGELLVTAVPSEANGACGLRRRVFVAEGLQVCYQPALRLPLDEGGLEQAEALLAAAPGMTAAPTAVSFGTERTDAELRLVAGPVVHTLRVVPPRLRVRVEPEPGSGGTPSPWCGNGALTLSRHELSRGGALRLDLPGSPVPPPVEVVADERVVQWLEPSALGRYPLRRLLDTVAVHAGVVLRVTMDGRTATVARVQAKALWPDPWLLE